MGNGERERNPSMWNGQNTTKSLVPDEFDVKLNHGSQSEQAQPEAVPDEKIEAKHSDVSSGKLADESLPKNMSKKTTQPKICHVKSYLPKLDISSDLIPPELHNRCLTLLETRDADAETNSKQVKEATKAALKTSTHLSSLFPKTKDAIFERIMSLCKKQNETRRFNLPVPGVLLKDDSSPPEASNIEIAKKNSKEVCQEASDSRIVKPLAGRVSREILEASTDQVLGEILEASNAEIVKPLADPASGEISEAFKSEMVKPLVDLDPSTAYILKPLTDLALQEISKDVVKSPVDQVLEEMSETNVSAAIDLKDELYADLDVVIPGEDMEPQSHVTSGATIIAENHSQVHEILYCRLPGTKSLHKKQHETNSIKFPVTSI